MAQKFIFSGLAISSICIAVTQTRAIASSPSNCGSETAMEVINAELPTPRYQSLLRRAAAPIGFVVGTADNIVLLTCGKGFLPEVVKPWLPLSNEIANVMATSTGLRWIYSGISKKLADSVSLGFIVGKTVAMTATNGPISGGITLAANMGLSFWFPNTYLHSILESFPKGVPEKYSALKKFLSSGVGQATIGIAVIVIIEQALHYSNDLAEKAPNPFKKEEKSESLDDETKARQALAAMLVDASISEEPKVAPTDKEQSTHDLALRYIIGNSGKDVFFSTQTDAPKYEKEKFQLKKEEKTLISKIEIKSLRKKLEQLLSDDQLDALETRLAWLQANI